MLNLRNCFVVLGVICTVSARAQTAATSTKPATSKIGRALEGRWQVDAQLTQAANTKTTTPKGEAAASVKPQLYQLTVWLKPDGTFDQRLGAQHQVHGTWSIESVAHASGQKSQAERVRLTLAPENLDEHADMTFDITFVEAELIHAEPHNGVATVFFRKQPETN